MWSMAVRGRLVTGLCCVGTRQEDEAWLDPRQYHLWPQPCSGILICQYAGSMHRAALQHFLEPAPMLRLYNVPPYPPPPAPRLASGAGVFALPCAHCKEGFAPAPPPWSALVDGQVDDCTGALQDSGPRRTVCTAVLWMRSALLHLHWADSGEMAGQPTNASKVGRAEGRAPMHFQPASLLPTLVQMPCRWKAKRLRDDPVVFEKTDWASVSGFLGTARAKLSRCWTRGGTAYWSRYILPSATLTDVHFEDSSPVANTLPSPTVPRAFADGTG